MITCTKGNPCQVLTQYPGRRNGLQHPPPTHYTIHLQHQKRPFPRFLCQLNSTPDITTKKTEVSETTFISISEIASVIGYTIGNIAQLKLGDVVVTPLSIPLVLSSKRSIAYTKNSFEFGMKYYTFPLVNFPAALRPSAKSSSNSGAGCSLRDPL